MRSQRSSLAGAGSGAFGNLLKRLVGTDEPALDHGLAQRSLARKMPIDAAVADIERTGNVDDRGLRQPEPAQHVLGDLENSLRGQNHSFIHARTFCLSSGIVDCVLDKTGTITIGNRQATDFLPAPGVTKEQLADAAQLASLADETPEGRSVVVLAKNFGVRARELSEMPKVTFVPFTAQTRMSGVEMDGISYRKGSADAIRGYVGGKMPEAVEKDVKAVSNAGGTP